MEFDDLLVRPGQVLPTNMALAIINDGQPRLVQFRWGLVPRWSKSKDAKGTGPLINARAETLVEKPSFRDAFRRRRCLIPADGFFEWTGETGKKQMWDIARQDGAVFAFAGLWEEWRPKEGGEPLRSCTIITTEPNEVVAPIHNRMPVILAPEAEGTWLDTSISDPGVLLPLLMPYPAELMTAVPVQRPQKAEPVNQEQLAIL